MLGHGSPEGRLQLRTVCIEDAIGSNTSVVEANLELGTGNKALVVTEIVFVGVLVSGRAAAGERRRLGRCCPFQLHGSRDDRIHRLRRGAAAIGRQIDAPGTGTGAANRGRGAARTAARAERSGSAS